MAGEEDNMSSQGTSAAVRLPTPFQRSSRR
jgi:hypothetical protein